MSNDTTPSSMANVTEPWWMPVSTPLTPDEWRERRDTAILFGLFGAFGIISNALPISFTFFTSMRKNLVNLMVGSLSVADFVFSVTFVFGQTQYILYREQLDVNGCRWLGWFVFITAYFDFIFPPQVSLNRYISLYHNDRYKKIYTKRNVCVMVVGTYLFCTVVPFIFMLGGQTGFDDDNQHCCIVVKYSNWIWTFLYWIVIITPLIVFCDSTMMYCNYKIYKKLSDHSQVQTLKSNVMKQNRELFYFLVADMCFPIVFHTVYHVSKFAYPYRTSIVSKRAFLCLYLINSWSRGLVTLVMLRPYRKCMKRLVCFWKKSTVSPTTAVISAPYSAQLALVQTTAVPTVAANGDEW